MAALDTAQQCDDEPQQATPADQLGPFYLQNSTRTSRVGPEIMLSDPTLRLVVNGRVLSSMDCNVGLAGITVELWYAGEPDAVGNYYQTNEYRGQVVTDECGEYQFTQTFPELYPERPVLHDHFRLSRNGEELLVTQMYFQGQGDGYVDDIQPESLQTLQVVDVEKQESGERRVQFDIFLNIEGAINGNCSASVTNQRTDSPRVNGTLTDTPSQSVAPASSPKDTDISDLLESGDISVSPFKAAMMALMVSFLAIIIK